MVDTDNSSPKTAAIIGVNGQDGTYLARHLIGRGFQVWGLGRQDAPRHVVPDPRFNYRKLDIRDGDALSHFLRDLRPGLIFHVAAVHASAQSRSYEPIFRDMLRVNVESLHAVLEHLRLENRRGRLIYGGSGKVFGRAYPSDLDESTPAVSTCLYSLSKIAARDLIRQYRHNHDLLAGYMYLFNHESPLRPPDYFVPKVIDRLRHAVCGERGQTAFSNLDFWCDWGSAEEYMGIAIEMAEAAPAQELMFATGRSVFARDFVKSLFREYGLDSASYIVETGGAAGEQSQPYRVDLTRLRRAVGRVPTVTIEDFCRQAVR